MNTNNYSTVLKHEMEARSMRLSPYVNGQDLVTNDSSVWPDPQPIEDELLPVNPLEIGMIPEPLRPWLADVSERMQCPIDYVASSALDMISSVIGAGCGVRPKQHDSWAVIPNLWGAIVGSPGTLKSPALEEIMKPLKHLETEAYKQYEAAQKEYLLFQEIYKCKKEAAKAALTKAFKGDKHQEEVEKLTKLNNEAPSEPTCKRLIAYNVTVEKLHEVLSTNLRGILHFRDELTGFLYGLDKEGHEQDRSFYLEAWNGNGSHTIDRIGRGTIRTENVCVSILGGIQPGKLAGYLYKNLKGVENDGLVQRFQLLVYPDEIRNWKFVDRHPDGAAYQRVSTIVAKIASMDFTQYGAEVDLNGRPYFRFAEDAQACFNQWITELETLKLRGTDGDIIVEHLAKYRSLVPSLALIFHVINLADGAPAGRIPLSCVELAIAWAEYLESHARRVYGLVTNIGFQAAKHLSKKIKKGELKDGFTLRDVYHKGWSFLDTPATVKAACEELEDAGWIKEAKTQTVTKAKTSYLINPKLGLAEKNSL